MRKIIIALAVLAASVMAITAPASARTYHQGVMQRHHDAVNAAMNSEDPAQQACGRAAAPRLQANDPRVVNLNPDSYFRTNAWDERKDIMREFENCMRPALAAWAASAPERAAQKERERIEHDLHRHKWGNGEHQIQMARDHAEIEPHMQSPNHCLRKCAQETSGALNGNDWHANIGYGNWAAWQHRKNIMGWYRSCKQKADNFAASIRDLRAQLDALPFSHRYGGKGRELEKQINAKQLLMDWAQCD